MENYKFKIICKCDNSNNSSKLSNNMEYLIDYYLERGYKIKGELKVVGGVSDSINVPEYKALCMTQMMEKIE